MARTFYRWKARNGATGRSTIEGIGALLRRGRVLEVAGAAPRRRAAAAPGSIGARIVRVAASQLVVREVPADSNRGPQVERYQRSTTELGTGWPWCMAFCRWVLDGAGCEQIAYRGAYVPHLEAYARATSKWHGPNVTPEPGWLVVFDWQRDQLADHVGIVEHSDGRTIEGNTTAGARGNQSNGGGVYRRTDHTGLVVRGYVQTY